MTKTKIKKLGMPRTPERALTLARKVKNWRLKRDLSEQREYSDMGIKTWGEYHFREYSGNCGEVNIRLGEHLNRCQVSAYDLSVEIDSEREDFVLDPGFPTREAYHLASKLFNSIAGRT